MSDIAGYDDWPAYLPTRPLVAGDDVATVVARALGVRRPAPTAVEEVARSRSDGVERTELRWHTGVGPETRAWYVRPEDAGDAPLPGVLALHCHANVKSVGAERLVASDRPVAARLRADLYGGRALADGLARAGFAVLAPDTFGWGSRRFDLDPLPHRVDRWLAQEHRQLADPDERYDAAAALHEPTAAKYAGALGTSMAGMAAHDDLAALQQLRALPGVDGERVGVVGFSGGGGRSAVLTAVEPSIRASAIVCMMSTYAELVPHHLDRHSWYFAIPGLPPVLDWPEVAAGRGAHDQLVVYAEGDELFPLDGMRAADRLLRDRMGERYEAAWFPGPHRFDTEMQDRATEFLQTSLTR